MLKRSLHLLLVTSCLLAINACILDPKNETEPPPPPDRKFQDLTQRDHVLNNLELAYEQRNLNEYKRLLAEPDFTFHFSATDIANGDVNDDSWGRDREIEATTNMFNPNYQPPPEAKVQDPISDIDLKIEYVPGDNNWSLDQGTPDNHPGEDWYFRTVKYDLSVQAGPDTYNGLDINATFFVRLDTVDGKEIWRIVSWLDDV